MKKLYASMLITLFLGLHLFSLDSLAQSCTQLSLPEHAIARLCIPNNRQAYDVNFSPDGKTLASVIDWLQVVLWDIENKTEKLTINDINGRSVRYSPDGKTLVCGDVIYDAKTGEPKLLLFDGEGYTDYVVYSPDGKTLAGAGPKGIRFWNSTTESTTDALSVGDIPIDILPTDTSSVVTSDTNPVAIPIATSSVTVPGIRGISYSPDGKELAIPCDFGIWIYDTELNTEKTLLNRTQGGHTHVNSIDYSSDGNILVSCTSRDDVRLWDIKAKKHKFTLSNPRIPNTSLYGLDNSVSFLSESNIFLIGTASGIHLYNGLNGEYKYTLPGSGSYIRGIDYSSNGNIIASASNDHTIILWDLTSYPTISISPDLVTSLTSLTSSEELTFDIKVANGKNISGYQVTIEFDSDTLEYENTIYGGYLSDEIPVQPIVRINLGRIYLTSISSSGTNSNGNGTLATIKFKVNAIRSSKLTLRDVIFSDSEGNKSYAWIEGAQIIKSAIADGGTCSTINSKDVNKDCVVNIHDLVFVASNLGKSGKNAADVNFDGSVDIIDLVLVAGAFGSTSGAPAVYADAQEMFSAFNVRQWSSDARKVNLSDPAFQRGIANLQNLLASLIPEKTVLLANFPNPFNPETWIPFQLANPASVTISIYSANGGLVRALPLGNQPAGLYQNRSRAAYWDGKNDVGEAVTSGVYFYTLTAEDFTATRKMLILK